MNAWFEVTGDMQILARRLALGTVQFGMAYGVSNVSGQVRRPEAGKIVKLAAAAGVDTIDTAVGYGDSERYLGEIGVTNFRIVTKLPAVPAGSINVAGWVNEQIAASLARLGVSRVYGLLLHRPADLLGAQGQALYDALCELKELSQVKKIGVSVYSPSELQVLLPKYRFDLVQAPLNLIDRRLVSSGWLKRLKDEKVEVHTRSAFLQGLLLMPRDLIPAKFAHWNVLWDRWHQWLRQNNETPVRACLAFPLSFQEVDRVLVGAESAEQASQILAAAGRSMTSLPDISSADEDLVNPANWPNL